MIVSRDPSPSTSAATEKEPLPPVSRCTCNGCTGRIPNRSQSRYVSHGLRMAVAGNGQLHWWATSRIVGQDE